MSEYNPPKHVVAQWIAACNCCPICQQKPCDGVMAGGLCDDICECDEIEELIDENN